MTGLREYLAILLVVEVTVGCEPDQDMVEASCPRQRAHVSLDVLDGGACSDGFTTRLVKKSGGHVEADDSAAACRERVRDAAMAAGEVEDARAGLQVEQSPDHIEVVCRALGR